MHNSWKSMFPIEAVTINVVSSISHWFFLVDLVPLLHFMIDVHSFPIILSKCIDTKDKDNFYCFFRG